MKINSATKLLSATILSTFLAISTSTSVYSATDISGHWAENVLAKWSSEGLISGFPDGTLRPDDTVTRAQFVLMIQNIFHLLPSEVNDFYDVVETDWFYNAVKSSVSNGIASGFPDGSFLPEDTVTRAQAAVFGANSIGGELGGSVGLYIDAEDIPHWCVDYVGMMTKKGYLSGMPDGSFDAEAPLTCAQAVSFLDRIRNNGTNYEDNELIEVNNHYIVGETDINVKNMSFEKNLVISDTVATDEVFIDNVFVTGNIVINGGSTVTINNTEILGNLIVNNKNVEVIITGNTNIENVEFRNAGLITSKRLTGKVNSVNIPDPISTVDRVIVDILADEIIVDGRSAVEIKKPVKELTINTENPTIITSEQTSIDNVTVNEKAYIKGNGSIGIFNANASEITYDYTISVEELIRTEGIVGPSTTSSSLTASGVSGDALDIDSGLNIDPIYDIFVYWNGEEVEDGDEFTFTAGDEVHITLNKNELPSNGFFSWQITCNCPGLFLSNDDKSGLSNVLTATVGASEKTGVVEVTYTYELGGVDKAVVKHIPFSTIQPK